MPPQSASTPTILPPRLKLWAMATRWLLALLLSFALLLGLGWALLFWLIVPRIDEFRPALERLAQQRTGLRLEIGQLQARSGGLIPSFSLQQVRVLDGQGQAALQLPQVLVAISPRSAFRLGLEQLVIEGAELELRRTADGRFVVAGIDMSEAPQVDMQPALDWLFDQTEWALLGGTVRWRDEQQNIAVDLRQVDWVMRNQGQRHSMRLDATPAPEWGDRFSLRGLLRQPLLSAASGRWRQWNGELYAEFGRIEAQPLQAYAQLAGIALQRGRGALRTWIDIERGSVVGALADVQLENVQAQLATQLPSLALRTLSGRLGWQQKERGLQASAQALSFESADGLRWPAGNVSWTQQPASGKSAERGQFSADQIDLTALAAIAQRLPLAPSLHEQLRSLQPQGLVEKLELSWQGPMQEPTQAQLRGRVRQLALASAPAPDAGAGRPGLQGADLEFQWTHDKTQDSGQAKLTLQNGWMEFPGVFEEARVPLQQLGAQIRFKRNASGSLLEVEQAQLQASDAQGQFKGSWSRRGEGPGQLDLQGQLARADAARVHRYLPLVIAEPVRRYVRDAVPEGQLSEVRFKLKGPLARFPFKQADEGEFSVSAKLRGAQYRYVPNAGSGKPWPAMEQLDADLLFNRASLQISQARAQVAGLPGLAISKTQARIADLTQQATVEVTGEINGSLAQGLQLMKTSPLAAMTGEVLSQASASGAGALELKLSLPLRELARSTVSGRLLLGGNDVQIAPELPALTQAKAAVSFAQDTVQISGAQARLLGGDVRFDGRIRPRSADASEPEVLFRGQGQVSAEALQQMRDLPWLAELARHASGSTSYSATLGLRQGWLEASISSNLRGLALHLPEPLNKPAGADWPLRLERSMDAASVREARRPQDRIGLQLNPGAALPSGLSLQMLRDLGGAAPLVLAGDIAIGAPALEPVAGQVRAQIDVPSLDLDAWEDILPDAASQTGQTYLPTLLSLRSGQLRLQGHQLQQVVLGASRERSLWRANMDASNLSGYAEYRPADASSAGRLYARLARLALGQANTSNVEAMLDKQPASIPALDIVVDELELRGRKLGRLEVEAINRNAGNDTARQWRLAKLNLTVPEARLSATGSWAALAGDEAARAGVPLRRQTQMNFRLDINDSGELLKRMGMDDAIRRGKGKLEGTIGWSGSPLALHTPSLQGQFGVDIESGQFLKAEPGAAKLLGVLNLQALPRRLTLDFRDVFSEGFAFDWVRGEVAIDQGVAHTESLRMKGVNAAVLMAGSADIGRETQDLKVVVVPEINAGTASLLASVVNPAMALGTFIAQWLLRRPLSEANTQEFNVRGTWADPVIERVARKTVPVPVGSNP